MAAIRWDNINAPSNGEALRGFEFASRGISSGFDKLGQVLADREAANQGVIDRGRESDKQGFLGMLDEAKTPEAMRALQLSGVLDQRLQALDPRSQAAVRGAGDARMTSLQQQTTAARTFDDSTRTLTERPILDQANALKANQDYAGLRALAAANPQVRGLSAVIEGATAAEQAKTKFGWDERAAAHTEALRPLDIKAKETSIAASEANMANAQDARELAKEQLASARKSATAAAATQFLRESGNPYVDGPLTPASTEELSAMMVKAGIGGNDDDAADKRQKIIERLGKLSEVDLEYIDKDNKKATRKVPVPLGLVKQAILGSGDKFWSWNEGWADTMEANLKKSMKTLMPLKTEDGREYTQNKAVFDFDQYMQTRMAVAENPVVKGGKSK